MTKIGAPPKEFCTRGHLMENTRKFHPNGDSYCSECKALRYELFRKNPDNAARIRAYVRKSNLKRNYGVDETFVDGKPCAICGRAEFNGRRPHVDHDHLTGEVRGILCHNCNTGIGLLGESNLLRALEYLGKAGKRKRKT